MLKLTFADNATYFTNDLNKSNKQALGDTLVYRFGWGATGEGGESKGVHIYQKISKEFQYHVFGMAGEEIFSSTRFKKESQDGCSSDEIRETWLLLPDTVFDQKTLEYLCTSGSLSSLVIGTKRAFEYKSPVFSKIGNEIKGKCQKALNIVDSTTLSSTNYYSAGTQNGISRILLETGGTVAVVEITGGKTGVLYKKTVGLARFAGQADLDQDGFCETFALCFGDYDGVWLLTCKRGKWFIWRDKFQPAPC